MAEIKIRRNPGQLLATPKMFPRGAPGRAPVRNKGSNSDFIEDKQLGWLVDQVDPLGLHQGSGKAAQPPVNPLSLHRAVDCGFLLPFHPAAGESVRMEGTRSGAAILRSPRQIPASPFISEGDSTAKGTPHNHPSLLMLAKT